MRHDLVINGIDYRVWNPKTDTFIKRTYSLKTVKDKIINKKKLLEVSGLPVSRGKKEPVIGMISRLAEQKGFDLISNCIEELMSLNFCFVIYISICRLAC